LSIGAVKFRKDQPGELGEKFYAVLDIEDQKAKGRTINPSTMEWWQKQSSEARQVLDELWDFIYSTDDAPGRMRIWTNGADFDIPQIASLFRMYGMELPWEFWNSRCFR